MNTYQWPTVFETKDITGRSNGALCADGLMAWANCMAGAEPIESFGEVLVLIGEKLNIMPTAENLSAYSKQWLAENDKLKTAEPVADSPAP